MVVISHVVWMKSSVEVREGRRRGQHMPARTRHRPVRKEAFIMHLSTPPNCITTTRDIHCLSPRSFG
jgi:hypothetical protein